MWSHWLDIQLMEESELLHVFKWNLSWHKLAVEFLMIVCRGPTNGSTSIFFANSKQLASLNCNDIHATFQGLEGSLKQAVYIFGNIHLKRY